MGTSGSGKTTLMNILGCLDRPTSGEFWLDGQDVTALNADAWAQLRNQKIGFVFQTFNLLPRTSALENVIMPLSYTAAAPLRPGGPPAGRDSAQPGRSGGRLDHEPSQLSGGQQQRVAIARALINNPSILFADEPTGNLDSQTSEEILELFRRLNEEEGVTIILVTHDEQRGPLRQAHHPHHATGWWKPKKPQPGQVSLEASPPARLHGAKLRSAIGLAAPPAGWCAPPCTACAATSCGPRSTTLGIIIGVAAVIAMMEIGHGSSSAIQATIASMGANNPGDPAGHRLQRRRQLRRRQQS